MSTIRARVRLDGKVREVTVERTGHDASASVDGRKYRLTIHEPRRGVYSFVTAGGGGRSFEAVVGGNNGTYSVRVRNRFFEASLEDPGKPGAASRLRAMDGERALKAQMPGRVVRVLAEAGTKIRRGQGIVVIEAMKMENEIGSPKDGVVKEVRVSPGDRVEAGALLATIQ